MGTQRKRTRLLALVLVLIFISSCFTACGKKAADNDQTVTGEQNTGTEDSAYTTGSTEGSTVSTDETEESTSSTDGTESTDSAGDQPSDDTAQTPSTPDTPAHKHSYSGKVTTPATCAGKGTKTFSCSCGSTYTESISPTGHAWGEWKTTKEPTTTAEGNSQRTCGNCGAAENQSIAKLPAEEQKTYYTSHEVIEIERPKTYYIDGVDVLTLARGENWVQVCDTIKIKVNMSDGGDDFEVKKWFTNTGYSYEKKGNEIWITPDGTTTSITVLIRVMDENGSQKDIKVAEYEVYKSNASLSEEQEVNQMLKYYGESLGMRYTGNGPEILTMDYTTVLIYENFETEAFRTLKKWANDGYTVFTMTVTSYCFDGAAGK